MINDWQSIIDKYYLSSPKAREILILHSRQVARMALAIAHRLGLQLTDDEIITAAMLHDIGIFLTNAPGIDCHGTAPYIQHGMLGADLLRREGFDEKYARVAERHTGTGLTADDIAAQKLPLPTDRVYVPETVLEKLVCYADKFFSKTHPDAPAKDIEKVRRSLAGHGADTLRRFEALHALFG